MMQAYLENHFGKKKISSLIPLAQAGSGRKYYRVVLDDNSTFIACENEHVAENETFFYFTEVFSEKQIPVPKLFFIDAGKKIYFQEDLGDETLLDIVLKNENESRIKDLYKKSLAGLLRMQTEGGKNIDFTRCFASGNFDRKMVLADLNYFKYYFLDLLEIIYDKPSLQTELEALSASLDNIDRNYFMFRDFQGRNIMIKDDQPRFIDYQGGMRGPLQYDVASLLWQAKAALPFKTREQLYEHYKKELSRHVDFIEEEFDNGYQKILLVRLLQVLGAYGLRGIIQQRSHFLSSIPYGLQNIKEWLQHYKNVLTPYPVLEDVLQTLTAEDIKNRFSTMQYPQDSPLTVTVQSFSYKHGIPVDPSGNGGGFMFDCRGVLNPGRFEEYKKQTGRDLAVIEFLESKTRITEFLNYAKKIVDISMDDYLKRGFENLQISFGCTGGQHRSVYCTDQMARYLSERYKVKVIIKHLVQDEKKWVN